MEFYSTYTDEQRMGNIAIGFAFGDQIQHFLFTLAEFRLQLLVALLHMFQQCRGYTWRQAGAALMHNMDGVDDVIAVGLL